MTQSSQRVFIVEDEVLVAFEMTDTLEDMGFEVIGPSVHLESAKETAKRADIDVAFLDVNLGRGDTSEPVAAILRKRDIPYVFITAYDRDQVNFIGEDERIVRKPVSGAKLVEVLGTVLSDAPDSK